MKDKKTIKVLPVWENNVEEWWEAARRVFTKKEWKYLGRGIRIRRAKWEKLVALPGWDEGPDEAPRQLVIIDD
jgi:hypothetical protein